MRSTTSKKSIRKGLDRVKQNKRSTNPFAKQTIRSAVSGMTFESLETRQLMAVINVADFGARPNDGANDLPAIQAALNASKAGDTILFDGGVFDLSGFNGASGGNGMMISTDRTYKGQNGATLRGKDSKGPQLSVRGNNVTITGLTFEGGGVKIDGNNAMAENIVINNNVFKLNTTGENPNCITMNSGLRNSRITNNQFTGYTGAFAIYGYNYNGLTIANNEVVNISAGFHIDAFAGSGNLLVEQNYISGVKGMGMEFQTQGGDGTPPAASNLVFQDNWFENPVLSSQRPTDKNGDGDHYDAGENPNANSMAYSLILDKSSNVTIRRNVVIAPQRPDGIGLRIGFEVGGDNTLVEDNYINGVNHALAVNDGDGSCSVTVRNNKFMNYFQNVSLSFPTPSRTWTNINNGPNTTLSSTMTQRVAASDKPGVGSKRYGTGGDTTPAPTPAPTPIETVPAGPTGLLAMATGATTVNLFWTDRSTNESGYKVERSTDGTTWTEVVKLGADAAGYTATGLTAGQNYSFRVRSFNAAGNSGYSNTATATPEGFDPNKGTYVSDLTPTSATSFWGQAENDMSNGEQKAGDGRAITIAGKTYAKGVGVHAGSEIHYALNGQYSKFTSDIGLDDETGGKGTVVFEVWADGQKLYSSGKLTAALSPQSMSVDVSGKQKLVLKVLNAGDSNDFDHADWAGAKLLPASPVVDPAPVGEEVYLSDLQWDSVANGWGTPELDKSNGERATDDGNVLTLDGKAYTKGIGAHGDSDIRYSLKGNYATFTADIGLDDEIGDLGSAVFQVIGDGVTLYDSGTMTGADATKSISVNVAGIQELWLVVNNAGDNKDFDHADWADAKLITAPPATPTTTTTVLSELPPSSQTNGWGQVETNTSIGEEHLGDGKTMTINGKTYDSGIGMHSKGKVVYQLNGQFTTFISDLGIDDEVGDKGSVTFAIWTDGKKVYDSGIMTGEDAAKTATINVAGKSELWLVVNNAGDGFDFDHADWAGARLLS